MKINYFPCGGRDWASSRLRVWKIADALRALGHEVVFNSYNTSDTDVAVFQKTWAHLDALRMFKRAGKRIIFDIDDLMSTPVPEGVDAITVDTKYKQKLYSGAIVIPDCLDIDEDQRQTTKTRKLTHNNKLKNIVWTGNAENTYHLQHAAEACRRLNLQLTVITDVNHAAYAYYEGVQGVAWSLNTVDAEMIGHDLFISPFVFDGKWGKEWVLSKSPNRILKAYGLGLPVIATMIPSFEEVGVFCAAETVDEWIYAFSAMQDRDVRAQAAENGFKAAQPYTADRVALQWLEVFGNEAKAY